MENKSAGYDEAGYRITDKRKDEPPRDGGSYKHHLHRNGAGREIRPASRAYRDNPSGSSSQRKNRLLWHYHDSGEESDDKCNPEQAKTSRLSIGEINIRTVIVQRIYQASAWVRFRWMRREIMEEQDQVG